MFVFESFYLSDEYGRSLLAARLIIHPEPATPSSKPTPAYGEPLVPDPQAFIALGPIPPDTQPNPFALDPSPRDSEATS